MFGGWYHTKHESTDDQTMPTAKLYSNHDCDDMALAGLAMARRLSEHRVSVSPSDALGRLPFSPPDVLNAVSPTLASFYLVQGKVYNGGGHTWAMLRKAGGETLHLECTQLMACHLGPMQDLYGQNVFRARPPRDFSPAILGRKPLDTTLYPVVCALYTETSMKIPTSNKRLCCDLETLLSNRADLHDAPPTLRDPMVDLLRATPSPSAINTAVTSVHGAYQMVYGGGQPVSPCPTGGYAPVTASSRSVVALGPGNAVACLPNQG